MADESIVPLDAEPESITITLDGVEDVVVPLLPDEELITQLHTEGEEVQVLIAYFSSVGGSNIPVVPEDQIKLWDAEVLASAQTYADQVYIDLGTEVDNLSATVQRIDLTSSGNEYRILELKGRLDNLVIPSVDVTKAYVDAADAAINTRIDQLPPAPVLSVNGMVGDVIIDAGGSDFEYESLVAGAMPTVQAGLSKEEDPRYKPTVERIPTFAPGYTQSAFTYSPGTDVKWVSKSIPGGYGTRTIARAGSGVILETVPPSDRTYLGAQYSFQLNPERAASDLAFVMLQYTANGSGPSVAIYYLPFDLGLPGYTVTGWYLLNLTTYTVSLIPYPNESVLLLNEVYTYDGRVLVYQLPESAAKGSAQLLSSVRAPLSSRPSLQLTWVDVNLYWLASSTSFTSTGRAFISARGKSERLVDMEDVSSFAATPARVDAQIARRLVDGSGSPEGQVFAAPGVIYRDNAQIAGAQLWIKNTAATFSTGWSVMRGDTGWRRITSPFRAAGTSGSRIIPHVGGVDIRRVNDTVYLRAYRVSLSRTAEFPNDLAELWVPQGYFPDASVFCQWSKWDNTGYYALLSRTNGDFFPTSGPQNPFPTNAPTQLASTAASWPATTSTPWLPSHTGTTPI